MLLSSLAFNPVHVLIKEVKKSTRNEFTRNRNALTFCLVLAFIHLGEKNKTKQFIGAILNKVLTVIPEAESRVHQCLRRAGEGLSDPHYVTLWHRSTRLLNVLGLISC